MQPPRRFRSAMRAPPNSAASTAVFLARHHYATSRTCVKWLTVRESMAPVNPLNRSCKGFNEGGEHMAIRTATKSGHGSCSSSVIWHPLNHIVWKRRKCKERNPRRSNLRLKDIGVTTTYWGWHRLIRAFPIVPIPFLGKKGSRLHICYGNLALFPPRRGQVL